MLADEYVVSYGTQVFAESLIARAAFLDLERGRGGIFLVRQQRRGGRGEELLLLLLLLFLNQGSQFIVFHLLFFS